MKVKATKTGFYGELRRPGVEFNISGEKAFSKVWMEKVSKPKSKKKTAEVEPEVKT